jgi:MFS family permease
MRDLHLSPVQFGFVGSSFFFLFSISGVIVGFIANRIASDKIVLVLALVWSIVQLPIAFTTSYAVLVASRIALGFGEGPAFPMALHTGYLWFENKKRNIPSTIIQQGANTGLMVAGPILTYTIVYFGWHSAFPLLAGVGIVWAVAWAIFGIRRETATADVTTSAPVASGTFSYKKTFSDMTFLSVLVLYLSSTQWSSCCSRGFRPICIWVSVFRRPGGGSRWLSASRFRSRSLSQ